MQNGTENSRGVRAIEMTITHENDVVYGREVFETMMWLGELKHYSPTRLVVIYKSPLPRTQFGDTQITDSNYLEDMLLKEVPRELGNSDQARGIFVRPLEEKAFNKHVEGLEFY